MLLLVRLFMVALSWFVGHVTWVVLFESILTEESKQSRSCVTSVALPSVALSHDSHIKDEEWCKSTHQSEYDFLPRSKLYIIFNLVVVCFTFFISSLYEDRIVNFVQRALNSWNSKRKGEKKGKDIEWIKKSIVHRGELEKLVETLKHKPNAVQTIGGYNVCFEESFVIGKGSDETKVFVGLGTDGVEVAIKRLKFKSTSEDKSTSEVEKDIMNLQKLKDNPYVLKYQFHTEMEQYAYLITDLQDGSLKQFVDKSDLAELQNKGPTILRQILLGIDALHDENILHRDLKPENVLVNFEGKMVLGDFGICRQLQPDQTSHYSVMRGTEGWMALESLPNENDDDLLLKSEIRARYSKESDVQVLGMLFYFVLTKGKHPFGKHVKIAVNIIEDKYDLNDLMDANAKDLIQWMLQHNKLKRPTVKQCLKHPYLMLPEEKFKFLTVVGNEVEIKKRDHNSNVVRELNQNASLTTPPWWEKIDGVYGIFSHRGRYVNNVTDLLRFMRNAGQHWNDKPLPPGFSTPQAVLLPAFPELPMVVYQVVRKDPSWCKRDTLKDFF